MADYKDTLNLPQTEFAMQAKLAQREPERLARWEAEGLYQQVDKATQGRPAFWLVDGPPYANGDIHIGHAVNKVLKDMIIKARRLDGFHAPYVPGWDCHGLPIELQVEKKHGKVGQKIDAAEFRAACREYAGSQVERQRQDFKRLGVLGDWDKPYLTMKPAYEAEQLRALARIIEQGHVVRGAKPVHWCLDCGSSLAEAEVEYQDKTSPAIDVKFPAADTADLARRFGVSDAANAQFVIWTTTPWTLPANQVIAVHAELEYALVEHLGARMVLASELAGAVCARIGEGAPSVLATVKGEALVGARAQHPFLERQVPIVAGDHVTLEAGTGLVHTAPAHGLEDFEVGQREGLPVDNPVAANGCFTDDTPHVGGVYLRKAEGQILELLEQRGALAHNAPLRHSYPHCWRHKTPLIFRATPQWFISMDERGLRQTALEAIAETQWIPAWGERRIQEMVSGRPDWCISRQRYWGVPMAVFTHAQTNEMHPDSAALMRRVADAVASDGLEAWFGSQISDWLGDEAGDYVKSSDTLDVWFDSGVVHQCAFVSTIPDAVRDGRPPQADFYLEGSDQHRGWFQSSLLSSCAMHGTAPYKNVLTHGFTVDEQGRKMSKSVGNVVAPQTVMNQMGADVLRLWVAASDYRGEIAVSDELLKRIADAYRRIRNTMRFLLGNLHGFDPAQHCVAADQMLDLDRWALAEAAQVQERIKQAYEECEFHQVYQRLHNYCVVDLGGLYLDILKDRLYTTPANSLARRSAQTAMFHIAEGLVRWITPILSFTAEEIWEQLPGDRSAIVFAETWHAFPEVPAASSMDWLRLRAIREPVKRHLEGLRKADQLGSSLEAELQLYADGPLLEALKAPGDELRFWLLTSEASAQPMTDAPADALQIKLEGHGELAISAVRSGHAKCERCWHRRADVGSQPEHPTICGRCVDNLGTQGEARRHV